MVRNGSIEAVNAIFKRGAKVSLAKNGRHYRRETLPRKKGTINKSQGTSGDS